MISAITFIFYENVLLYNNNNYTEELKEYLKNAENTLNRNNHLNEENTVMLSREKIKAPFGYLIIFITLFIFPALNCAADDQMIIEQTPATLFPIVIDQPGNYLLVSDLIVSTPYTHCLHINSDEVILDLNNHSLVGPGLGCGPEDTGIYAFQKNNITILNGLIQEFFYGLNLSGNNHEIKNVTASHNSSHGFKIESSTLIDCLAEYNDSTGFTASSCTITNCSAYHNGSFGLKADSCTVTTFTAENNSSHGIYTIGKCLINGCDLSENEGYGLYLGPDYSYAVKNKAHQNAGGSFYSDGSHYMPTSGNDANFEL